MSSTKVGIKVDYKNKEIRLVFREPVYEVGMSVETAKAFAKMVEEKVRELEGKIIILPPTQRFE